MKRSAVIVHFDGIAGLTPLVGGYLKAFALADAQVRDNWEIELYQQSCRVKASRVIRDLVARQPDLVAFSVYMWNVGLVRRLLPALRGLLPRAHFLLGGVEVMNVASSIVHPTWENVAVCNGEGERTFREVLLELGRSQPDWQQVGGVTFARDGAWCTTPGQPRIEDLSELPSPWLTGMFDEIPGLDVALFETNRGCPFACEFCFWGGAIGQKIYQQDLERIRAELDWIGKRGIRAMSIADANFGIMPRDAEIAEHIVAVSKAYGGPLRLVFNSSKVRPDRVERISTIFAEAGLLTRHVFSLQSMSRKALEMARRTSLEREPYTRIQRRLNEQNMASLIELLWPMPGETLDSFKDGVDDLLEIGAQGFLIYPLMWLNNTGYRERTAEYGVTVLPDADPAGAGEIVIGTREVSFPEYLDGLRFAFAEFVLHDCRGLYATMQILNALGVARFRDVLDAFGAWMDTHAEGPLAELWRARMASFEDMTDYTWRGEITDALLHTQRVEFDRLLAQFVAAHDEWFAGPQQSLLRAAVEYDLLSRPYVFLQTRCEVGVAMERIEIVQSQPRGWLVRAAHDFPRIVGKLRRGEKLGAQDLESGAFVLRIDHKRSQFFLLPRRTHEENRWQCTQAVQEIARIEPRCTLEADCRFRESLRSGSRSARARAAADPRSARAGARRKLRAIRRSTRGA